jgi:dTDP-4-dehydrorhamnose 3,5-epimerase
MATPRQDKQTVTPDGEPTQKLPEGVTFKEVITQVDDRGSVCEMFDPRWGWHSDPLVFAYTFTIRPGIIKGWGSSQ